VLLRRARAKFLSTPLGAALAECKLRARKIAELYGEDVNPLAMAMEKSYRHTVYCSATLDIDNGKVTGRYCGNRWCLVCNRVRTGMIMTKYQPVLLQWRDRYFVTLTAPNVMEAQLPGELRRYRDDFTAIKRALNRTHKVKLVALRKLECTYNPKLDTYHPHFHVVVQGKQAAQLLHDEWLARRDDAKKIAQDIRPADDNDVRELFKYFTKLITRTRETHKQVVRAQVKVADAAKLDVIFSAMRGLRVFQPVGFTLPKADDAETAKIGETGHTAAPDRYRYDRAGDDTARHDRFEWSQESADWVNDDGEALAYYTPSDGMRTLVRGIPQPEHQPEQKDRGKNTLRKVRRRTRDDGATDERPDVRD
jgi:hypothetical protein